MSDGTIHAGIGMLLNFGWERKEIKAYLDNALKPDMSARCMAWLLANACNDLYMDNRETTPRWLPSSCAGSRRSTS